MNVIIVDRGDYTILDNCFHYIASICVYGFHEHAATLIQYVKPLADTFWVKRQIWQTNTDRLKVRYNSSLVAKTKLYRNEIKIHWK